MTPQQQLLSTIKRTRRALTSIGEVKEVEKQFGPMPDQPTPEQVEWLNVTYDSLVALAGTLDIKVPYWPNRPDPQTMSREKSKSA